MRLRLRTWRLPQRKEEEVEGKKDKKEEGRLDERRTDGVVLEGYGEGDREKEGERTAGG